MSVTEMVTGKYREGKQSIALWPSIPANPSSSLLSNPDPLALWVVFELPTMSDPIVRSEYIDFSRKERVLLNYHNAINNPPSGMIISSLLHICSWDSLRSMNPAEKKMLWDNRYYIRAKHPQHLPKVLLACPFGEEVELRVLVDPDYGLPPLAIPQYCALEMLDSKYANVFVRKYAVECVACCSDYECELWLLQFVQALKYEASHFSALAYFLIWKALHSQKIAMSFFWFLVAEAVNSEETHQKKSKAAPSSTERFLLYIDTLLNYCDEETRQSLIDQITLMDAFCVIAGEVQSIKQAKDLKKERTARARQLLTQPFLPPSFTLPTDPDRELASIEIDKCKAMVSAAAPIWLTFSSPESDAEPFMVMFKKGDDLRKDILVLNAFRTFDHIWKNDGLDLRMTPYAVVMTGLDSGLVQIVPNSTTFASIQRDAGGVLGPLQLSALQKYFESFVDPEQMPQVVENFIYSCAGYCVATHVLGIGDRHNDNIMVTETGVFFHIDFGFILGDYLKFIGIERETAPFILTSEFVRLMGEEGFKKFAGLCTRAYQLLRNYSNLIIALFSMMLGSNIPGMSRFEDLHYLRTSLALEMNDEEAEAHFKRLIKQSLASKRTIINFIGHIMANW